MLQTKVPVRPRLDSLTGLRFYAAFVVLLRHAVPPLLPAPVLEQLAVVGTVGVSFFFVLSGFVLIWTWCQDEARLPFYRRRFARVYPLHLVTTILAIVLAVGAQHPSWVDVLASLILIQAWLTDPFRAVGNGPSWSLSCEAFFYAMFPLIAGRIACLSRRGCAILVIVTVAAMAGSNLAYAVLTAVEFPAVSAFSTYTNPIYRIGEFTIGMTLGWVIRSGWRAPIGLRAATSVATAWYGVLAAVDWWLAGAGLSLGDKQGIPLGALDLLFLPTAGLLIVAAATADLRQEPSPFRGRISVALGEWSFALYLIQLLVIDRVVRALPDHSGVELRAALLVATLLTCVAAAWAAHVLVERPANSLLRSRKRVLTRKTQFDEEAPDNRALPLPYGR